ncbi:hypothetical protein ACQP3F_31325, partial [Escherichia coli]
LQKNHLPVSVPLCLLNRMQFLLSQSDIILVSQYFQMYSHPLLHPHSAWSLLHHTGHFFFFPFFSLLEE